MKTNIYKHVLVIFICILLGQLIPLSFIILDLNELGINFSIINGYEIYLSQKIYPFSSIIFPTLLLLLFLQFKRFRKQKIFFENILNGVADPIYVISFENKILFKNKSALAVEEKDVLSLDCRSKPINISFEYTSSIPDEKFYLGSVTQLEVNSKYILILRDITILKNQEAKIKQQEQNLVRSGQLAALGEIASGIAHEINNPLGVVIGNLEILKENLDTPTPLALKCISTMERMACRMSDIIKAMKNLSRVGSNNPQEIVLLDDVFNDVLSIAELNMKKYAISFSLDQETLKTIKTKGSRVQLSQVFLNLLTNAIQAINKLEERWIKVKVTPTDENIYISFENSGNQIPKDIADKIFQPFFTTKSPGEGTGLGLSLSQNIITHHEGDLHLDLNSPHPKFIVRLKRMI